MTQARTQSDEKGNERSRIRQALFVAARLRALGLQAIDGPNLKVRDADGFRRSSANSAALGYAGKWVLYPTQIEAANQAFAPSAADYSRAARIIEA